MKYSTYCVLAYSSFLNDVSANSDDWYTDSLSDCLDFASHFDNTCQDLENPVDFD